MSWCSGAVDTVAARGCCTSASAGPSTSGGPNQRWELKPKENCEETPDLYQAGHLRYILISKAGKAIGGPFETKEVMPI